MLDAGTRFEIVCVHCPMRLVVEHIRDAQAMVMADHLREHHDELRLSEASPLGAILDHYRVADAASALNSHLLGPTSTVLPFSRHPSS